MLWLPGSANDRGAHQPKGRRQQREGLREGKRNKQRMGAQGVPGKGARARSLTPGKNSAPVFAPTRPHLTLAQQEDQAHLSSTVEWG